jgi:LacI family transcriptional regulator
MAKIREIAAHVGLSYDTVAQILSPSGRKRNLYSPDTQRRVIEAAAKLGYRSSNAARGVKTGILGNITLVMCTRIHTSYVPPEVLTGVRRAVTERGYHLSIAWLEEVAFEDPTFVPRIAREWSSDGLLVSYTLDVPTATLEAIHTSRQPAVFMNVDFPLASVRPDDFGAGMLATQHLIKLGHRRIQYADSDTLPQHITGEHPIHYYVRHRYEGYLTAMREAGLEPRASFGGRCEPPRDLSWLDAKPAPTAVVMPHDAAIAEMLLRMTRTGRDVPRDLSVVVCANSALNWAGYQFDVVQIPHEAVAYRATCRLLNRIVDAKADLSSEIVPCTLLSGNTTRPA